MHSIFSEKLSRLDLLNLSLKQDNRKITIALYRNHSFEMVATVINSFLDFSGLCADFLYSDYDDSLNFQVKDADLHIIWIDTERYHANCLSDFIKERTEVLRSQTDRPILIVAAGEEKINISSLPSDSYLVNINELLKDFSGLYDIAKEPYSGTKLSNKACLEIARILGLQYIPAIFLPPFKAIVVDLDNTLYKGILGEDGIDNLILDIEFQKKLKKLKDEGFFLCIASKNEEEDVKTLFQKRKDFILKLEDFTVCKINWESKANNIVEIAKTLNIGLDSILFIDDNPAEIQNVEHLGIKTILAENDISQVIKYYPGLLKFKKTKEDLIRSKDIQANLERARLISTLTKEEYFKKLGIKLSYGINIKEQIPRVAELLNKTNQFILSYLRYNETQIKSFVSDSNNVIITVKMSDNLSDSGIIAILLASKSKDTLLVQELTVSCRALGRNLENVMLPYLFKIAREHLAADDTIEIKYKKGERNAPAIKWLEEFTRTDLEKEGIIKIQPSFDICTDGLNMEVLSE